MGNQTSLSQDLILRKVIKKKDGRILDLDYAGMSRICVLYPLSWTFVPFWCVIHESFFTSQIAMLQDEREELKRECRILREKCKDNDHISSTNMDLMKKMRTLQEQLYNEQDSSREKLRNLREVGLIQ